MSDTPTEPLEWNIDTGGKVDTSRPIPVAGDYVCVVSKLERKENKDKTGYNAVVTLALTHDAVGVDGRTIPPGYKIVDYMPLQAKAGADDPEAFKTKLCRFFDACMHTDNDSRPDPLPFGQTIGRKLIASLKIEDDPGFGKSAKAGSYKVYNGD